LYETHQLNSDMREDGASRGLDTPYDVLRVLGGSQTYTVEAETPILMREDDRECQVPASRYTVRHSCVWRVPSYKQGHLALALP
jgi:hypothetical protein